MRSLPAPIANGNPILDIHPCNCGDTHYCRSYADVAAETLGIETELRAAVAPADVLTPIDPADPVVVRYADRSKGWGRAMDRIDAEIARCAATVKAIDDYFNDPDIDRTALDPSSAEIATVTDADRQWWTDQTPDSEGLTDREEGRFALELLTVSALDRLLDGLDGLDGDREVGRGRPVDPSWEWDEDD